MRSVNRAKAALVGLGIVAAGASAAACGGYGCNDIGAYCALDVDLSSADWQPGSYTFEMKVYDDLYSISEAREFYSCTETLPWPADTATEPCSNGPMALDGAWRWQFEPHPYPLKLALMEQRPSKVEVRILRDGVELVSETLRPSYEVTQPWGGADGCGTCSNATESLTF